MGEVLENGVYLPDEGERNAYDGLKGNWNTVDTVVAQVQALSSTGLIRKAVDALPTEDIETNVIYMLKAVRPNNEVYRIEYMYIDNHWDAIGTSETTLDDYYTKTETDNLPAVSSGVNATKVGNYDSHLADTDIHVTLANKQTWDGKQNALDTAQTAAVNSGITGTKVTGYDSHVSDTDIHVTTSDKTAWNGKQDGLSQTQFAAVNSGITEAKRTGYDSHVADTNVHVTTADKAAWNGKQNALTQTQLDNIAAVPDKANAADLATVATTGDYGDLQNAPTIPTVNNATLTIQKNGADVATFTANASSNVTANLSIPVNTSDLNNDAGFLTQHNPIDNELSATSENALQNKVVKSELDGKAPLVHTHAASDVTSGTFNIARIPNLDASKITSGTIDIARLPKGSLERLIKVADQSARYALTTDDVQLGDTVQQLDTGVMYVVTDETKLDSADGYTEFTAGSASSVPWTGVTGKPSDYPPSSHTHTKSQITDFPTLATVATSGEYSDLNNIPASFTPSSHTHGNITNDGKVGTAANKPLITGTGGAVQAGSFGTSANTFCEGNDSRLSDARTPVAHTHGSITNDGKLGTASVAVVTDANKNISVSSVTATELGYLSGVTSAIQTQIAGKAPAVHTHTKSDVTDLFNSVNEWSALNTYSNGQIRIKSQSQERGVIPSSSVIQYLEFADKNDAQHGIVGLWDYDNGASEIQMSVSDKYKNGVKDSTGTSDTAFLSFGFQYNGTKFLTFSGQVNNSVIPLVTNAYDLGSSSYQWNHVYAKNYYYNGTAWGLDKYNQWTGVNDFNNLVGLNNAELWFKHPNIEDITTNPSANTSKSILQIWNKATTQYCGGIADGLMTDGTHKFTISCLGFPLNNYGGYYPHSFSFEAKRDGTASFSPNYTNASLGTSTNKWKSFNGINPGALSLPSATVKNIDTFDWNFSWNANIVTAPFDGYISIACFGSALQINNETKSYAMTFAPGSDGFICGLLPVSTGDSIKVLVTRTQTSQYEGYKFIKSLGNVS